MVVMQELGITMTQTKNTLYLLSHLLILIGNQKYMLDIPTKNIIQSLEARTEMGSWLHPYDSN